MKRDDFVVALGENEILEDSMKLVNIVGTSVLLAKHAGKVYAVSNRCPHMGCSLATGKLKEYIVTCPCHGWSFDIRNGQHQVLKQIKLTSYECKIENGKILVSTHDK